VNAPPQLWVFRSSTRYRGAFSEDPSALDGFLGVRVDSDSATSRPVIHCTTAEAMRLVLMLQRERTLGRDLRLDRQRREKIDDILRQVVEAERVPGALVVVMGVDLRALDEHEGAYVADRCVQSLDEAETRLTDLAATGWLERDTLADIEARASNLSTYAMRLVRKAQ
jgi:hypothetical protein